MTEPAPVGGGKRHLYQRRWVWIVGVLIALFIIGSATSKSKDAKATKTASTSITTAVTTPTAATTPNVTQTTGATTTTRAPTTTSTAPQARTTVPTTSPPTTPTTASYPIVTAPSGNEYHAGEFCPKADLNMTVEGSDGPITCENISGYYRWVNA